MLVLIITLIHLALMNNYLRIMEVRKIFKITLLFTYVDFMFVSSLMGCFVSVTLDGCTCN